MPHGVTPPRARHPAAAPSRWQATRDGARDRKGRSAPRLATQWVGRGGEKEARGMSRSTALPMILLSSLALGSGVPMSAEGAGHAHKRTLLSFHTMFGVDGAFVG